MFNTTPLAVVLSPASTKPEPSKPGSKLKTILSVFYYDQGGKIRESCFDTESGWYSLATVVASDAAHRSPITAAIVKEATGKIRTDVFYLDNDNHIHQVTRSADPNATEAPWDSNIVLTSRPNAHTGATIVTVPTTTKLTAAITQDKDKSTLLIYQNADGRLIQLKSNDNQNPYRSSEVTGIVTVGCGLSLVTGPFQARLYYEGHDRTLTDLFSVPGDDWQPGRLANEGYRVSTGVPISAVAWGYTDGQSDVDYIRVYSVNDKGHVFQAIYDRTGGGWQDNTFEAAAILETGVAAVYVDGENQTRAYYQPANFVIGEDISPAGATTAGDVTQLGIPTMK